MPDLILIIETTANFLRGMALDPSVPLRSRELIRLRIQVLDEVLRDFKVSNIEKESE